MIAGYDDYSILLGQIPEDVYAMARCACVACNSCTCACSCRAIPDFVEIEW